MATCKATFVVYHRDTSPGVFDHLNYVDEVKSMCIMNSQIIVYTVREIRHLFRKSTYLLDVKFVGYATGRPMGIAEFDTLDEANNTIIGFLKQWFPEVTHETLNEEADKYD